MAACAGGFRRGRAAGCSGWHGQETGHNWVRPHGRRFDAMSLGTGSPLRNLAATCCFGAAVLLGWCCSQSPGQGQPKSQAGAAGGSNTSAKQPAAGAGATDKPADQPLSAAQRKVLDDQRRAAAGRPEEAFKGWEKPAAVLILTGEQQGYLEPCGCTENQAGGLARRMELFHQMWQKGWPTLALDVGGNLNKDRLTREQAKFKLDFF